MPNSFKDRLKELDGQWKDVKGDQNMGFEKHPNGTFVMVVRRAEVGESKNKDNPRMQVAWEFRNVKGKYINKTHMTWDAIQTERGMAAIKGRLMVLTGKVPARTSDLPEALDAACDVRCLVKISESGKYQNTEILKRLKNQEEGEAAADEAGSGL